MTEERLLELLSEYVDTPLSATQVSQLHAYLELLLKWNARMNLTAIRDEEQIARRHFGESLEFAQFLLEVRPDSSVGDFGSGAGFPGLPMAIYSPAASVTLIESQHKKSTFLKEAVRVLGLRNVLVESKRGEEVHTKFKIVTMRAVDKFEAAAKVAITLVEERGILALMISQGQVSAVQKALIGIDIHWGHAEPVRDRSRDTVMLFGYR